MKTNIPVHIMCGPKQRKNHSNYIIISAVINTRKSNIDESKSGYIEHEHIMACQIICNGEYKNGINYENDSEKC